jgi:hypothetical protein
MAESEKYHHWDNIRWEQWGRRSFSSDEFPDAIDRFLWYQHPPPAAGQIAPFHETPLGKLPREIHDNIWSYVIATESGINITAESWSNTTVESEINITVFRRRNGRLTNCSYLFRDIIRLVGVCQQMRSEIFHSVHRNITFVHDKAFLGHIIATIPRDILRCIGVLELTDRGYLSCYRETRIGLLLSLICDNLPNLVRFQLGAIERKEAQSAPTRTRDLLRFGSFLVARHQNLDLLIWPGDSGETHMRDEERIRFYIDVASSRHFAAKPLFRAPTPKYLSERDAENDNLSMVEVSVSLCSCLFSVLTDRFAGSFVERHDAATASPRRYPCPFNRRLHHRQREQYVLPDRRGA